jgi:hypothetical protein
MTRAGSWKVSQNSVSGSPGVFEPVPPFFFLVSWNLGILESGKCDHFTGTACPCCMYARFPHAKGPCNVARPSARATAWPERASLQRAPRARRARSSGPTLVPRPRRTRAAPAHICFSTRGLGRFSAAPTKHDARWALGQQASRITPHASMVGCRIEHVVPEEVAQVAVVIVVFPVVVLVRRARGCNVWSGKIVTLFYMYIMRRISNAGNRNTHLSSQPPTRSVSYGGLHTRGGCVKGQKCETCLKSDRTFAPKSDK